jgi:thiol:disulfide interchange protein
MKPVTWLAVFSAGIAVVAPAAEESGSRWMTNVDEALAKAKAEKKDVLVEFTGSDWCPPCIVMRKKVFKTDEFIEKASKKFVLVEIDLPKGNKVLAKRNQPVAERYKIEGLPTVLLLSAEGREFGRFPASEYPSTGEMMERLESLLSTKDFD